MNLCPSKQTITKAESFPIKLKHLIWVKIPEQKDCCMLQLIQIMVVRFSKEIQRN